MRTSNELESCLVLIAECPKTSKPLIYELMDREEWALNPTIHLQLACAKTAIENSILAGRNFSGANDSMKQLLSPSHYLIIAEMK